MSAALIVIDVQNEYVTGALPIVYPPVDQSLARIAAAIDAATTAGIDVIAVRHTEPDPTGGVFVEGTAAWELHKVVTSRPHSVVIDKQWPGSFTGTPLEHWLREHSIDQLVIAGYMTHMCVDTTARQAMHRGWDVMVLSDATGTIDLSDELPAHLVHRVELGVLGDGFGTVCTTDDWIKSIRG
ncbi:MAG: cysteine hydrolase family protein [Actinomycetes bacterium]